jgi:hypothetical protein
MVTIPGKLFIGFIMEIIGRRCRITYCLGPKSSGLSAWSGSCVASTPRGYGGAASAVLRAQRCKDGFGGRGLDR